MASGFKLYVPSPYEVESEKDLNLTSAIAIAMID